jgi:RND family efflux transporter MFP subunit
LIYLFDMSLYQKTEPEKMPNLDRTQQDVNGRQAPSEAGSATPNIEQIRQSNAEFLPPARREKKSVPGRSLIWGLGLLLVGIGAGWGINAFLSDRSQQQPPATGAAPGQAQAAPVKLATLESATVEDSLEVVAALEARRNVTLRPEVAGRVTEILVNDGDRVRQGQTIFRLDSDDQQAELSQAQAALASSRAQLAELEAGSRTEEIAAARASLEQAQARLTNARRGSLPQEIAQAQAQVESAQAAAELARQRVNRYRQLRAEGAISEDQYQEYVTSDRSNQAALQEAQRRLAQLRESRQASLQELTAAVEQQRQNLRRLENGARVEEIEQARAQVAEAQARVRTAEVNLDKTTIASPLTGVVGDIPIKRGAYVSVGDDLTSITENEALEVNLSIPTERRADLRLGLPVEILDNQGKVLTKGKISFISPNVTADSQLVLAKAALENVNNELLNSQFIRARVILNRSPGVLVPTTAISRLGGQAFVFVAEEAENSNSGNPQLIARQKPVELGDIQGNSYQVIEGLEAGERIVTAGLLNLSDGAPIAPSAQ